MANKLDGQRGIKAEILADSISEHFVRLTTFQLRLPMFLLKEVNTHRMAARVSASSRARPVRRVVEQVRRDPAGPIEFGSNQRGMQAGEPIEFIQDPLRPEQDICIDPWDHWRVAAEEAANFAEDFEQAGVHKQVANRVLESFQYADTVFAMTDWDNFFKLRYHSDAQPEFYELAKLMYCLLIQNQPRLLTPEDWHLPYVTEQERETYSTNDLLKSSVARCARVSYKPFDRNAASIEKDINLHDRLYTDGHLSPFDMVARPMKYPRPDNFGYCINPDSWEVGVTHLHRSGYFYSGNYRGWVQYRHLLAC